MKYLMTVTDTYTGEVNKEFIDKSFFEGSATDLAMVAFYFNEDALSQWRVSQESIAMGQRKLVLVSLNQPIYCEITVLRVSDKTLIK